MAEQTEETGPVMKFIQDYRLKMLIPELLVVFGVWYFLPILDPSYSMISGNVYENFGVWMYIFQPLYFLPSGVLVLLTAFTLHGIYPLDNYHEGKISSLPKAAVIMIAISFFLLPVLVGVLPARPGLGRAGGPVPELGQGAADELAAGAPELPA